MKILIGILGYVLLITGALFINAPIIALLAIPVYLVGIVLIIKFIGKSEDDSGTSF